MKRIFSGIFLLSMMLNPVLAADYTAPKVESVKTFAAPYDSRFQYGLPEGRNLNVFNRNKSSEVQSSSDGYDYEDDEILLDTKNVKPEKKVIKKLSADTPAATQKTDRSDEPMNYNSFPKFYNSNDLMNQQFMPMMGY